MAKLRDLNDYPCAAKVILFNHESFQKGINDNDNTRIGTHVDVSHLIKPKDGTVSWRRVQFSEVKVPQHKLPPSATSSNEERVGIFSGSKFQVYPIKNATVKEIKSIIDEYSGYDYTDCGCLIIIILTHGARGGYLTAYDGWYHKSIFWKLCESPNLRDKPVLFFIQACRSDDNSPAEARADVNDIDKMKPPPPSLPTASSKELPKSNNTLIAYCTVEDRSGILGEEKGSWFISKLIEELSTWYEKPLFEILTSVTNNLVNDKGDDGKLDRPVNIPSPAVTAPSTSQETKSITYGQTSVFHSTLSYDIIFTKMNEPTLHGSNQTTHQPLQMNEQLNGESSTQNGIPTDIVNAAETTMISSDYDEDCFISIKNKQRKMNGESSMQGGISIVSTQLGTFTSLQNSSTAQQAVATEPTPQATAARENHDNNGNATETTTNTSDDDDCNVQGKLETDGKAVLASRPEEQTYPKKKYQGKALIVYDQDHKDEANTLRKKVEALKLHPIMTQEDSAEHQVNYLKKASKDDFDEDSCLFVAVLARHDEHEHFTKHLPKIKSAFLSSECKSLALKPKIFLFLDVKLKQKPETEQTLQTDGEEDFHYVTDNADFIFIRGFGQDFKEKMFCELEAGLGNKDGLLKMALRALEAGSLQLVDGQYPHNVESSLRRRVVFHEDADKYEVKILKIEILKDCRNNTLERPNSQAELRRHLDSKRSVFLCGPRGTGKTEFILMFMFKNKDLYPNLILLDGLNEETFVNQSTEYSLKRLAQHIGKPDMDTKEVLKHVSEHVGDKRVLIVIDNCNTGFHLQDYYFAHPLLHYVFVSNNEQCKQMIESATSMTLPALSKEEITEFVSKEMKEIKDFQCDADTLLHKNFTELLEFCKDTKKKIENKNLFGDEDEDV